MVLDKKFAEVLTQSIIARIKTIQGDWTRPWFDNPGLEPRNLDGKSYKGLNKLLLSLVDGEREIPVYMTFLRAKEEGISVLSGEKSLPVQYASQLAFHWVTRKSLPIEKYKKLSVEEQSEYKVVFMMKHYNVFNVDQTNMKEVKPELYKKLLNGEKREIRELEGELANPLMTLLEENGWCVPIHQDQVNRAYYNPTSDSIHLPGRGYFKSDDYFFSTMLHEVAHSTGHPDRLNRNIGDFFGSQCYSREELVAELSSAVVGQTYGVSKTILENNACYLESWLSNISQTPDFLNEVLDDVVKASDLIIDRVSQNEQGLAKRMGQKKTARISLSNGVVSELHSDQEPTKLTNGRNRRGFRR